MRRPIYVLPARPWWHDAVFSALLVAPLLVLLLFFGGCGDNIDCPPPPCRVHANAAIVPCPNAPGAAPRYTCAGFVANVGCTVPVVLPGGEPADALCVSSCEATP